MKNEPVAWMQTWENQDGELKHTVNIEQIGKQDIPLYTHPAELTDEEILKQIRHAISFYFDDAYSYSNELYSRIETILRKANEK